MMKPLLTLLLLIPASLANAELRVHGLFTDHAVLQRGSLIPVWGLAREGERVLVTLGGETTMAEVQSDGDWIAWLPERSASTGLTLTVTSGTEKVELRDISIGELWLGSGQSNMAMQVKGARDFAKEQQASNHPQIRFFTVKNGGSEQPESEVEGSWQVSSPSTVGSFSATGYFFARELHEEIDVPVGVIVSAVGGTPIQSWIRADAQEAEPSLQPMIELLRSREAELDKEAMSKAYESRLSQWRTESAAARKRGEPAPRKPTDPVAQALRKLDVGGLYNGKISPLVPYAVRGVLWYQGEANSFPDTAMYYQHQLPLLVRDWRQQWNKADLPVAWVQLPNYKATGRDWPTVRQAMLDALAVPNTGMAITIDLGETNDIHPKNKQDVGRRLARWALSQVYGRELTPMGPLPQSAQRSDQAIEVSFRYVGDGLRWMHSDSHEGFELQDASGEWLPGTATLLDEQTVRVAHDDVAKPVAVRYLWENDPTPSLSGSDGIPASPFEWDVVESPN